VHRYLRHGFWDAGHFESAAMRALLGVDAANDDAIVGFGVWTIAPTMSISVEGGEDVSMTSQIVVRRFGLDRQYHGVRDRDGHRMSDRLYAALEDDIVTDPATDERMPIYLVCEADNLPGRAFWERQGFTDLGFAVGSYEFRDFVRSPWATDG
jgi:hypothetical protein